MFEKFKKTRKTNSLRRFIVKTKQDSNSSKISLDDFGIIIQSWKSSGVYKYDNFNSTLLANLLKEIYGNTLDAELINILDQLIFEVTEIVNGRDDDNYEGCDSFIIRIIRILGVLGTSLAEDKLLSLLGGSYDRKVWQIVDDGLYHAMDNLSSEQAIDAFIQFVKTDHPRNTYVEGVIITRLGQLQSQVVNPITIEKLREINHELDMRKEKKKKANMEFENAILEAQRAAEYKKRDEESQKWWDEHPDQERNPSQKDR